MNKITYKSSVIFVENIEKSKRFYSDILRQEIEFDFGENVIYKSGFAIWKLKENHIINQKLETLSQNNRLELYFEITDIEETQEHLEKNNINFFHKIQEEPWGQKTIRFFDPDNHLIEIGETLQTFIKRMYNSGMTIEQINVKSSVPAESIKKFINS